MKFKAYSFNEDKKEITLDGIVLDKSETKTGFGINVALVNGIELFFDNITGMILYGTIATDAFEKNNVLKKISPKPIVEAMSNAHVQYVSEGVILPSSTEKIKMTFLKQNVIVNSTATTKLSNFMNQFDLYSYFKSASFQQNFGNQSVGYNSVLIFPIGYTKPIARNEETFDLAKLGMIKLSDVPAADCLHNSDSTRKNFTDTIYKFNIGKFELAEYIPESNVLIMSNIFYVEEWTWLYGFFNFLKSKLTRRNKIDEGITMGCDPEFELYNKRGEFQSKDHILNEGRLQRKIGADGHGDTLELRPEPSEDPAEVVADLVMLFDSLAHLDVSVKGDKEALGGHIHFGAPQGKKIQTTKPLLDALDTFIGLHFQKTTGSARRDYGRKGDYRPQPWGFEYRTPPASIFATKEIAYITMKLAKNILETINIRTIEASVPLQKEDLYQFLTKEEADYYFNFPNEYSKLDTRSIIKYWTKEKGSPITIKFYDEWSEKVKNICEKMIKDCICDKPTTICMYGTVDYFSGLKISQQIPHKNEIHCNEGIAIGVPLSMRLGTLADAQNIAIYVKQKIIGIMGTKLKRTTEVLFPEELIGSRFSGKVKLSKKTLGEIDHRAYGIDMNEIRMVYEEDPDINEGGR